MEANWAVPACPRESNQRTLLPGVGWGGGAGPRPGLSGNLPAFPWCRNALVHCGMPRNTACPLVSVQGKGRREGAIASPPSALINNALENSASRFKEMAGWRGAWCAPGVKILSLQGETFRNICGVQNTAVL